MLPEIALTTQIISRLRKYFGDKVGCIIPGSMCTNGSKSGNAVLDKSKTGANSRKANMTSFLGALFPVPAIFEPGTCGG